MPRFRAEQLQHWTQGRWRCGRPPVVTGFSIDTRKVRPGESFVALKTARRDGHEYLEQARAAGASMALVAHVNPRVNLPQLQVEDPAEALQTCAATHRQSFKAPIVAITGSCGKTSTKELLALLLGDYGIHRTPANLNNTLGVPLTLLGLDPEEHRFGIIEAGMNQPGEMALLGRIIDPDISIITLVAPAHLEGVGSLEGVAVEKAALGHATRRNGLVLFPEECRDFEPFRGFAAETLEIARDATTSASGKVTMRLDNPLANPDGTPGEMHLRDENGRQRSFRLPFLSPGMARNAALALTVARKLGVGDAYQQLRLLRWTPPAFRGQRLHMGSRHFYVDCYNANPASLLDSIEAFHLAYPEMPRLYVLGCMSELGEHAERLHAYVGSRLHLGPRDEVLILGEHAEALEEGLLSVGNAPAQITILEDVDEAIVPLESFQGAVLLKGSRQYRLETLLPDSGLHDESPTLRAC